MPILNGVKETALYVTKLSTARQFYVEVMQLQLLAESERFAAFDVAGNHILLLFLRGASLQDTPLDGGIVPPHDGSGPLHIGFSVDLDELARWEAHFASKGISVESRITWPPGGKSIYFRDPDGHLLELLTPGVWKTY